MNKSNILFLTLILLALIACKNESQENEQEDQFLPDSINTEGMSEAEKAEIECLTHTDYICESGLFFARLGDYVADVQASELKEATIEDSVVSENGYDWVVRTLALEEGRVIVEGEFVDQRESNDTILSATRVNRLRIESPLFQTSDNVRVGDKIEKIADLYSNDGFQIISIPDYEVINIQVTGRKFHYHLSDKGNKIADSLGEGFSISDLPQEAIISAIVVM